MAKQGGLMHENQDNVERILEEINTQLRHLKWIMVAGLGLLLLLLLTLIFVVMSPILVGVVATFLIAGPVGYLYYIFVTTLKNRESRLSSSESKQVVRSQDVPAGG
jgi:hypothetical protein